MRNGAFKVIRHVGGTNLALQEINHSPRIQLPTPARVQAAVKAKERLKYPSDFDVLA